MGKLLELAEKCKKADTTGIYGLLLVQIAHEVELLWKKINELEKEVKK